MVGIYYIATGSYKVYFDGFINSLNKFRKGKDKTVIYLTDEINKNVINGEYKGIKVIQHMINDAPWPIVTLLKMWFINQHKGDYDEIYYFNANAQCINDIDYINNKLILSCHNCSNGGYDGHRFLKINEDNPLSLAYIGVDEYEYTQAAFFGGDSKIVYKMCEDISKWVEWDLIKGIIPRWHDETYLNKWFYLNKDKCCRIKVFGKYIDLVYNKDFCPKRKK
jgi:hypothetical protein